MVAEVIVDINHSNVDKVFEYALPDGVVVECGSHVLVPFGRGDKSTEGFVIGFRDEPVYTKGRLKSILHVIEKYPVLTSEQIELAKWMRDKYNCLLVDALCVMVPAQLRGGRVREKTVRVAAASVFGADMNAAKATLMSAGGKCKSPQQFAALCFLEGCDSPVSLNDIREITGVGTAAINALEKKGFVVTGERGVLRQPYRGNTKHVKPPELTREQAVVTGRITSCKGGAFLIHGVTGSGKTEVYMRAIEHVISLGKRAIMLVPEISLTPQTVERFSGRFGERVAVLHSRLSSGERFDEWRRIRLGAVDVVVGARSAVFAPISNLGLIAIDEEHESSYHSEHSPRYDTYDVAQKRRSLSGATLILGSATPSLESYYRAKQGELELLELKKRINGRPLPPVTVVDMRAELAEGNRSIFSAPLYEALKQCTENGHQAMLLLNRRGYSNFVTCRACGYTLKCERCDVSLTYHKYDDTLRCHYCDSRTQLPPVCPKCKKPFLKTVGIGTQQVEEAVEKCFPNARVLRMDRDTTVKKDSHLEILNAFKSGQADILIGTQMIAKGLDFPQVTLVGVILADLALHLPDYRSAERAFSLITQVAGRAGRDEAQGRVIVQTYTPEHPSIVYAKHHDYEGFYNFEIAVRKSFDFPPFSDFVRFSFEAPDLNTAKRDSDAFSESLKSKLQTTMAANGIEPETLVYIVSMPAPIGFIKDAFRYQVLLKLKHSEQSESLIAMLSVMARDRNTDDSFVSMEVNPQNML